jgi:NADH-quinone oxidoreductase subunit G
MSEEQTITIEVDGRELKAKPGAMLIEVTDDAGIHIPRFCYHKKLSTAANCRMCLVEVEKVPKPLPACATPVNDGMKVFTKSPMALAAQKGTMEFLLINHPLDCPICDQGGECELQDVSLGYGDDFSRFIEGKHVVPKVDIGPLINANFDRCIHCTRCVRFGAEIAGIRELGATGRGEHMTIGTYIEKSIDSELSGNVIDLCPVGSLTSRPYRYQARPWELVQREAIAPHDSLGSNLHLHIRGDRVMRIHPKDNEAINECWISDRDRFSYEGLYSDERLTAPLVKNGDKWEESDWEHALEVAAKGLKSVDSSIGALLSPTATLEELHLAQKLVRGLGSDNMDFRLRQGDFRGTEPVFPWLGRPIADLDQVEGALVIGSNLRKEMPMLNHRLRKAAMNGAAVSFVNPLELDLNYRAQQLVNTPAGMISDLAAVAKSLGAGGGVIDSAQPGEGHKAVAEALKGAADGAVLLGNLATAHPDYSLIRALGAAIATAAGAKLGYLPEATNSVGARIAGALPRGDGKNACAMLEQSCKGYLLLGVEPGKDFWNPSLARKALSGAECVVALSAFRSPDLEAVADVILPLAGFAETSGTYVNAQGSWQSFAGATVPLGEARPGWKILRVLGNLLNLQGFDQVSSDEVLAEVKSAAADLKPDNSASTDLNTERRTPNGGVLVRIGDVPLYSVDPLVRRARALQKTADAAAAAIRINSRVAAAAGLEEGAQAAVVQDGGRALLPVIIDASVPDGCVRVPAAVSGTEMLGGQFGEVSLEKI